MGQIANAEPESQWILRPTAARPGRSTKLCHPAGPCTPHRACGLKPLGEFPDLCSQGLRPHRLVERAVRAELFELAICFFHLSEAPQLAPAEVRVCLLPGVDGGGTPPERSAEVADRGAAFSLPDGLDDLLFRECRPLHRSTPFVEDRRSRHGTRV